MTVTLRTRPALSDHSDGPGDAMLALGAVLDLGEDARTMYAVAPRRALVHHGRRLTAGEIVEGAESWPRLESWLRTGQLVEI